MSHIADDAAILHSVKLLSGNNVLVAYKNTTISKQSYYSSDKQTETFVSIVKKRLQLCVNRGCDYYNLTSTQIQKAFLKSDI